MKSNEKGLQKLTDTKTKEIVNISKINQLLSLDRVTKADLKTLNKAELEQMGLIITEKINTLKDCECDKYWEKIDDIVGEENKNQRWENNHSTITATTSMLIQKLNRMPSIQELSEATKISRQTIYKHIGEYKTHQMYKEQIERFRFMGAKVLANVYQYAVQGDLKACKLYLDTIGYMTNNTAGNTHIQNQNNYIQINGITLSQNEVQNLNPEQLKAIEEILKNANSKT